MNFLAHLYLSGADAKIKVGNFIGDFVRGRNVGERFERGIAKGIELHREIDAFTDHHPVVLQSKIRLRPGYRHYSPVIVDVFYDHFLAHHWSRFSSESLANFARDAYHLIEQHSAIVPAQVNSMLPYMIGGNWLVNYAQIEGIHRTLAGMARRTPYASKMETASTDLRLHYDAFEEEFLTFFPELVNHSKAWLEANKEINQSD